MTDAACPSREELSRYVLGAIPGDTAQVIAAHLRTCESCERAVTKLEAESKETGLRAASLVGKFGRDATSAGESAAAAQEKNEPLGTIRVYELLEQIGQGGMGTVYKARHTELDKIVALKLLPAEKLQNADAVGRFKREMKAVGRLDHQHIVRAMDAGEENGLHYLVMEYVRGVDLAELVRRVGSLRIADACELVRQAALGLQEAHEHGMVHRDIKPSNLILASAGTKPPLVKVLDMGLALLDPSAAIERELTSEGQIMGTIDYMAPEQGGDSHLVDIRADVYSLGATLYKLLAGESPFGGPEYDKPMKKMASVLRDQPVSLRTRRKDVPHPLADFVAKLLAKSPQERPATPQQVADALQPFCRGANLAALLLRANACAENTAPASERSSKQKTEASYSNPSGDTAVTMDMVPVSAPKKNGPTESVRARPKWYVIAAAGGAIGLAVLGIILFLQTPNGVVKIEINDPDIKVVVDADSAKILPGGREHEIKLKPGAHGLTITRGDFSFGTTNFEFNKGDDVVIKVTYLPGNLKVTQNNKELMNKAGPREPGKIDIAERPPENEPVGTQEPVVPEAPSKPEVSDYALRFDSESTEPDFSTVKVPSAGPWTVEGWVTPRNPILNGDGRAAVLFMIDPVWISVRQDRGGLFYCAGGPTSKPDPTRVSDTKAIAGERVHLAMTRVPEGVQFFCNGVPVGDPLAIVFFGVQSRLRMRLPANEKWRDVPFLGDFDEVRVSSSVRYKEKFDPQPRFERDANTVALFHFDEGTGDVVHDASENKLQGKVTGTKWIEGPPRSAQANAALEFDGVDDCVTTPFTLSDSGLYEADRAFTYEAWVMPEQQTAVGWSETPKPSDHPGVMGFYTVTAVQLTKVRRWSLHGKFLPEAPRYGEWQHLAAVWDGKVYRLFVDGKPAPEILPAWSAEPNSNFSFGGWRSGTNFVNCFRGKIDEVRLSKVARYTDAFKPEPLFKLDAETLALYHCDEGVGTELKDASASNRHATLSGGKWISAR